MILDNRSEGPAATAGQSISRPDGWFAAALVVAVFLVYQPCWQGGWIWDDVVHVAPPELRDWHGLYRIWFDVGATMQYYPLSYSSFWIEHKLWGDSMLGYHWVNILLHCTSALMAALVLRRLAVPGAYLAAAVFALHPVCVESVAWIQELKNTLSTAFSLGAVILYLHFDRTRKTPWRLGALALFVAALLSKTAWATLPAALLLIFWWQRGRLSWRRDVGPLAPFFLAAAAASLVTMQVEHDTGALGAEFDLTWIERCLLAGRTLWFYLGKLYWPADLYLFYPLWQISRTAAWQYLFPAAALVLLAVLWGLRRWRRGPLAGLLFFAGTLFPVSGFFNVYFFKFSFVADHFQYLPSLGMIALASAGAASLLQRWRLWGRPAGNAVCLLLLATLAGLTWRQSRMYADTETLYRTTIERNPDCWLVHNNLGNILAGYPHVGGGQVNAAIAHYQKALEINPDYAPAHYNLGNALASRGEVDAAIAQYQEAIRIKPDYAEAHYNLGNALAGYLRAGGGQVDAAIAQYQKALEIEPDYAEARVSLGNALSGCGKLDEAIAEYRKAVETRPDYAEAHYNLGVALAGYPHGGGGKLNEGIAEYRKAVEIKPDYVPAHINLGIALVRLGQIDEAIAQYEKVLKIAPNDPWAYNNLAWIRATHRDATIRDGVEAVTLAGRAVVLLPGSPSPLGTLAAAYAEAGRFTEAVQTARQALELAKQQNQPALAESIQAKIRLYETGAPFREPPQAAPQSQ